MRISLLTQLLNSLILGLSIGKEADALKAAQTAKYNSLKQQKQFLEDQLKKKLEELFSVCEQEAASDIDLCYQSSFFLSSVHKLVLLRLLILYLVVEVLNNIVV